MKMNVTTVKLYEDTKNQLNQFREYKNESYDELIKKMVFILSNLKKQPRLSSDAIKSIEKARERIKKGKFLTELEAKKRLGL